jgi:hypothetical protein
VGVCDTVGGDGGACGGDTVGILWCRIVLTPADENGMRAKVIQDALQDVDIHIDTFREKVQK